MMLRLLREMVTYKNQVNKCYNDLIDMQKSFVSIDAPPSPLAYKLRKLLAADGREEEGGGLAGLRDPD